MDMGCSAGGVCGGNGCVWVLGVCGYWMCMGIGCSADVVCVGIGCVWVLCVWVLGVYGCYVSGYWMQG